MPFPNNQNPPQCHTPITITIPDCSACSDCPLTLAPTPPTNARIGELWYNTGTVTNSGIAQGKFAYWAGTNWQYQQATGSNTVEKEVIDLGEIIVTEQFGATARVTATTAQLAVLATLPADKLLLVKLTNAIEYQQGFTDSATTTKLTRVQIVDVQQTTRLEINFSANVFYQNSITRLLHVEGQITDPYSENIYPHTNVPLLSTDYEIVPQPHLGDLVIGELYDADTGLYAATVVGGQELTNYMPTQLLSITLPQSFPNNLQTLSLYAGTVQIINIPTNISDFGAQVVGLLIDSSNNTCQFILPSVSPVEAGTNGTNGVDGTNGLNGAPGANGTNGTNGIDGKTILNGAGAPATGLGTVGDYYLDNAATRLYGPKTSASWGTGVSLVGPAGSGGGGGGSTIVPLYNVPITVPTTSQTDTAQVYDFSVSGNYYNPQQHYPAYFGGNFNYIAPAAGFYSVTLAGFIDVSLGVNQFVLLQLNSPDSIPQIYRIQNLTGAYATIKFPINSSTQMYVKANRALGFTLSRLAGGASAPITVNAQYTLSRTDGVTAPAGF